MPIHDISNKQQAINMYKMVVLLIPLLPSVYFKVKKTKILFIFSQYYKVVVIIPLIDVPSLNGSIPAKKNKIK